MMRPWFKFHAQQFLTDTRVLLLSDAERGVLVAIWCHICTSGNFPADPKLAGKLLGMRPTSAEKALTSLRKFFITSDEIPSDLSSFFVKTFGSFQENSGLLFSIPMLRDLEGYVQKCETNMANGSRGGRPSTTSPKDTSRNPVGFHDGALMESEEEQEEERERGRREEAGVLHLDLPEGIEPDEPKEPTHHPVKETSKRTMDPASALGGFYPVWAPLVQAFGPKLIPARDLLLIRTVLDSKVVNPDQLVRAATALFQTRREHRYMPTVSRWLKEGGHLVHTPVNSPLLQGAGHGPAHRRDVDLAGMDQILGARKKKQQAKDEGLGS